MKKVILSVLLVLALLGTGLGITAARHQTVVRPNTFVKDLSLGGLTPEEAKTKLREWWDEERRKPLKLQSPHLKPAPKPLTPGNLGVTLDEEKTLAGLPMQGFVGDASSRLLGDKPEKTEVPLVYKPTGKVPQSLVAYVKEKCASRSPAGVTFREGKIIRKREVPGRELDAAKLPEAVIAALRAGGTVELPIKQAAKRVPDEVLAKVQHVIGTYSTTFATSKVSRCSNIRLAASKLDGILLMPGETLSFNGIVGRRTPQAGYKMAGVYLNGRHDVEFGGGICQVSTTLYNAALYANLKIVKRLNHSMPVPYAPLGRDATVDFDSNTDLVIANNTDLPLGVDSEYTPGRLTFRILGQKVPGQSVKVVQGPARSWANGTRTVRVASLPAGVTRVVESGSAGHSLSVTRIVQRDGVEVARESLGQSYYRGAPRIVHVGSGAPRRSRRVASSGGGNSSPAEPAIDPGVSVEPE